MIALKQFVEKNGVTATATRLHISPQRLHNWTERGVPIEFCAAVERMTKGEVTRRDLRPDDWHLIWPELADPDRVTA